MHLVLKGILAAVAGAATYKATEATVKRIRAPHRVPQTSVTTLQRVRVPKQDIHFHNYQEQLEQQQKEDDARFDGYLEEARKRSEDKELKERFPKALIMPTTDKKVTRLSDSEILAEAKKRVADRLDKRFAELKVEFDKNISADNEEAIEAMADRIEKEGKSIEALLLQMVAEGKELPTSEKKRAVNS